MNRIAVAVALVGLIVSVSDASTLLIIDQPGCPAAARFMSEVAADYPAKGIPLQHVTVREAWPKTLGSIAPPRSTPTFILIENNEEAGRFSGYSSARAFWRTVEETIRSRRKD
jgi:hypothetical protein